MGNVVLTRERLLDWPTLVAAYRRARAGKRHDAEAATWFRDWESRLVDLRARLAAGYVFGPYRTFQVHDPKTRDVAAAPFADRIVHHAIVACLEPYFECRLAASVFACRQGRGGRAARAALLAACRKPKHVYFLKCDIRRYFPSIRHDVLLRALVPACGDAWSLELLRSLLNSWHTSDAPGTGIPIGNLTSQLFANVYLMATDQYMLRTARASGYMRYVDDMLWFCSDKATLWRQRDELAVRLAAMGLHLHPRKTRLGSVADRVDFAGLVAGPGVLRLRGASKRRSLRYLRQMRRDWRRGTVADGAYLDRLRSLVALARFSGAARWLRACGFAW